MTPREFEEETKEFSIEKNDLKEKVNDLFEKGANTVSVLYFIIEHKSCTLQEAFDIVQSCINYQKRFQK